jgi:hypothetical protein
VPNFNIFPCKVGLHFAGLNSVVPWWKVKFARSGFAARNSCVEITAQPFCPNKLCCSTGLQIAYVVIFPGCF